MAITGDKTDTKPDVFTAQYAAVETALNSAESAQRQIEHLDAAEAALGRDRDEATRRGDTAAALGAHDDLVALRATNERRRVELAATYQGTVQKVWAERWPALLEALRIQSGVLNARYSAECDRLEAEREALSDREQRVRGNWGQVSEIGRQVHYLQSLATRTTSEGAGALMTEKLPEVQSWAATIARAEAQEKQGG